MRKEGYLKDLPVGQEFYFFGSEIVITKTWDSDSGKVSFKRPDNGTTIVTFNPNTVVYLEK